MKTIRETILEGKSTVSHCRKIQQDLNFEMILKVSVVCGVRALFWREIQITFKFLKSIFIYGGRAIYVSLLPK